VPDLAQRRQVEIYLAPPVTLLETPANAQHLAVEVQPATVVDRSRILAQMLAKRAHDRRRVARGRNRLELVREQEIEQDVAELPAARDLLPIDPRSHLPTV